MATTDQHSNVTAGATSAADEQQEREAARKLAERYRYAFVDLREQRIDPDLFRSIPADLMFRYNFVPLETHNNVLSIAAADPGQEQMSDAPPLLLGKGRDCAVASRIGVLSELDIAGRWVPADGRFRVKCKGRFFALRASTMPSSHGEDAVLPLLDKETFSAKFQSLSLGVGGFCPE